MPGRTVCLNPQILQCQPQVHRRLAVVGLEFESSAEGVPRLGVAAELPEGEPADLVELGDRLLQPEARLRALERSAGRPQWSMVAATRTWPQALLGLSGTSLPRDARSVAPGALRGTSQASAAGSTQRIPPSAVKSRPRRRRRPPRISAPGSRRPYSLTWLTYSG